MGTLAQRNEDRDGVRFSWIPVWPSSKSDATDIVKLACLYTPLKEIHDLPQITQDPILCTQGNCKAILNPLCKVDDNRLSWDCNFCLNTNRIPSEYRLSFELQKLPELSPQSTTVEYTPTGSQTLPPIFLFVVDTCIDEKELSELKDSLKMSLSILPPNAWIGLITYGKIIRVHKIDDNGDEKRQFTILVNTDFSEKKVKIIFGSCDGVAGGVIGLPFLQPLDRCHALVFKIIGGLQPDSEPDDGKRPLRSTGAALSVALSLLECTFPNTGARVMLFAGGACSQGPGMVINDDMKETFRSRNDIDKGKAKFMKKATKHYEELASRACTNGHAIDLFACALDQTGLLEMKSCCNTTGGHLVMGDSFGSSLFKETFQGVFAKDARNEYKMAFNALMEVKTSPGLKVCGTIGPCTSMNVKGPNVSETELGIGGTSQWKFCALGTNTTPAVFFEVVNQHGVLPSTGCESFIQLITQYQHSSGQKRVRVTTIDRNLPESKIADNFDQEAAAVLVARLAAFRADSVKDPDILHWLDRMLVSVYRILGVSATDDPNRFVNVFAELMFHLRRSTFLEVVNNSPDKITFYRHMLNSEDVTQALIMVQPRLSTYRIEGPCQPVLLDSASIQPDRILLLDSYFQIVIYIGEEIAQRRALDNQNAPEYEEFEQLLQATIDDAKDILKSRFLKPGNIFTEHGGSKARFLLKIVNPSQTDKNMSAQGYGWGPNNSGVQTDDESFQIFLERIEKMVVSTTGTL